MHSVLTGRARRLKPATPTILDSDASEFGRNCLLQAARNAGLEPSTVVDVAQALTGRPWAYISSPEIAIVARALLSAANRVAFQPSAGGRRCAS